MKVYVKSFRNIVFENAKIEIETQSEFIQLKIAVENDLKKRVNDLQIAIDHNYEPSLVNKIEDSINILQKIQEALSTSIVFI